MAEPDEARTADNPGGAGTGTAAADKDRAKKRAGFLVRAACFAVIAVLLLSYATYVLTPKYDYGICSMVTYYSQEPDTVDVLTIGTSMAYAGINTNVLWKEYGIATYNLCSAEQPFWVSYYTLKEALKTQHPKVILLDAKPAGYKRDYSKRGRTILSTFGIRGIGNRIGATLACVETPADAVSYLLGMPEVHSNYQRLGLKDLAYPPDNGGRGPTWKGYIESDETEAHERPAVKQDDATRSMHPKEEEYVRKIFELARKENIKIMLVGLPNPDYANDHPYYNTLWNIAARYGITGINYNDPNVRLELDYSEDFADWQHLNVKGSVIFTRKLAQDLLDWLKLPDRRGDPKYESWEECARIWYEKVPSFETSGWETHPPDWFGETPESGQEAPETAGEPG